MTSWRSTQMHIREQRVEVVKDGISRDDSWKLDQARVLHLITVTLSVERQAVAVATSRVAHCLGAPVVSRRGNLHLQGAAAPASWRCRVGRCAVGGVSRARAACAPLVLRCLHQYEIIKMLWLLLTHQWDSESVSPLCALRPQNCAILWASMSALKRNRSAVHLQQLLQPRDLALEVVDVLLLRPPILQTASSHSAQFGCCDRHLHLSQPCMMGIHQCTEADQPGPGLLPTATGPYNT